MSNGNGSTTPVKIRRNSNGNGKPPLSPSSTNGGSSSSSTGKYRRKRSIREQMLSDDAIIDKIGEENNIKVGTIADLIDYRLSMDATIESVLDKDVKNEFGEFKLNVWRDKIHDEYHFSLLKGDIQSVDSPLVRVQTQSILQDTLGIDELGKNWSIRDSLKRISNEGVGLFVLINYKDSKSYWLNKLEEKEIEPKSNRRVIGVGSQILRALNLKKITVLGTPTKYNAVSGFDIEITGFTNE